MTFPTIPTVAAGRVLTAVQANTTAARTFPDLSGLTKNSGDLLIAICIAYQSNATANAVFSAWGGGFTEFLDYSTTTGMAIGAAYLRSNGTETGTFTVTEAATITGHAVLILLSIPGAHPSTNPEGGSGVNTTTTTLADPPSFDPAGWAAEDTLWIAVGADGETSLTGSYTGLGATAPTNYSDRVNTGISADAVGGVEGGVAFRQLNASAEDVGTWSAADTSNSRHAAVVIAIRPDPATTLTVNNVTQAQVETTIPLGVDLVVQNVAQAQKVANVLGPGINPPSWVSQTLVNTSSLSGVVDISGAPDGDWVYAFTVIAASQTGNIAAGAAGEWTTLVEGNQSTATHYALHRRKKQAGDTTFTFTWDTTQKATILLSSWPGPDATTPEDTVSASNVQLHSAASGNYPTPSVTPAGTGRWAAVWSWLRSTTASPGSLDWTADAALVERNDQSTSSSRWVSIQLSDSNGSVTVAAHSYTPTNADTAESNGGAVLIYLAPPTTGTDLVLGTVTQAQPVGNLALTQVHELAMQGAVQGQVEGNVVLTQVHNLTVQGVTQAQVESSPTLVASPAVQGVTQAQVLPNIDLTLPGGLAVQSPVQGQVTTTLALTQVHVLAVQGAVQGQSVPNVPITKQSDLVVQNVAQGQVESQPTLTQVHVLTVQGAVQGQVTTEINFTGSTNLVVQNVTQAQPVPNVVIVRIFNLVVGNVSQAQTIQNLILVRIFNLLLAAATSGQVSSTIILTQAHNLSTQGASQGQLVAAAVLTSGALPLVRSGDGTLIQRLGGGTFLRQGSGEARSR